MQGLSLGCARFLSHVRGGGVDGRTMRLTLVATVADDHLHGVIRQIVLLGLRPQTAKRHRYIAIVHTAGHTGVKAPVPENVRIDAACSCVHR